MYIHEGRDQTSVPLSVDSSSYLVAWNDGQFILSTDWRRVKVWAHPLPQFNLLGSIFFITLRYDFKLLFCYLKIFDFVLLCRWHVIRKAIWYVTNFRIFEILRNIYSDFFFNVQNWDSQQGRDSCLKINKCYVTFKLSNFKISSLIIPKYFKIDYSE